MQEQLSSAEEETIAERLAAEAIQKEAEILQLNLEEAKQELELAQVSLQEAQIKSQSSLGNHLEKQLADLRQQL